MSTNFNVSVNAVTGVPLDREIAVMVGDYVVFSHLPWNAPFASQTMSQEGGFWNMVSFEWGRSLVSVDRSGAPSSLPRIAKVSDIGFDVSLSIWEVQEMNFQIVDIKKFQHTPIILPKGLSHIPVPQAEEDRLLAIAKGLCYHHAGLINRIHNSGPIYTWELLPYGTERGKQILDYTLPIVREAIKTEFPDVDVDEAIRQYRRGNRVFEDASMAKAVARYSTIAPLKTTPEDVGQPMGAITCSTTSLVYCGHSDVFWVNTGEVKKGQPCPCCQAPHQFHRHPDWSEYWCDTPHIRAVAIVTI